MDGVFEVTGLGLKVVRAEIHALRPDDSGQESHRALRTVMSNASELNRGLRSTDTVSYAGANELRSKVPVKRGATGFDRRSGLCGSGPPNRRWTSGTVYLLAGGRNAENERLLESIAALPPEYKVCFLESGEYQGTTYVVTDVLAGNPPLREWVAAIARKRAEEKAANPEDLTRVRAWKIPVWAAGGQPVPPRVADTELLAKREADRTPEPKAAEEEPDDFMKMLGAVEDPSAPTPPTAPEPEEFTRPMQAPQQPPVAPPLPPQVAAPEPGEFTRLLQAQQAPATTPVTAPGPGETTRLQASQPPPVAPTAPPQPPPVAAPEPGEFTRLLQAQQTPPAAPVTGARAR